MGWLARIKIWGWGGNCFGGNKLAKYLGGRVAKYFGSDKIFCRMPKINIGHEMTA